MVPPVVPSHNLIFILVESRRCIVARFVETAPYRFEIERATNWTVLGPVASPGPTTTRCQADGDPRRVFWSG